MGESQLKEIALEKIKTARDLTLATLKSQKKALDDKYARTQFDETLESVSAAIDKIAPDTETQTFVIVKQENPSGNESAAAEEVRVS